MKTQDDSIVCDNCGKKGARTHKVSRSYGKGKKLLVIENVPVVTCPNCGESYLTADVLQELERIKLHGKDFVSQRLVAVASFR
jgi:YgiT-type zinc finger domain-containing protein